MRIFLSHSSKQKPLVREIKEGLPDHLAVWLDEQKLLFGDSIPDSIETTIKASTDYVLLFVDEAAAASDWVQRELLWTLEAEREHNRTILLPVAIEEGALPKLLTPPLDDRKYLKLHDYHSPSVRALSTEIASELFALVCRDMHRLSTPQAPNPFTTISDAEALLLAHATIIQKAVFPHRSGNPLTKEKLIEVINSLGDTPLSAPQLDTILAAVLQRNLIPGLVYDGFEVYILEEHARWKAEVNHEKKERIGRKTASLIRSGMKVLIDAGSTAEEAVKIICRKIENRAISRLTVATTSVNIADMISDCCVKMGFDDDFSAVQLYIPGGQVRPGTQAIVATQGASESQVKLLSDTLGGFDLGIIGVNGIDLDGGLTTQGNRESSNKRDILACSERGILIGDSSKVGIVLEDRFADFGDDLTLIIDDDKANSDLQRIVETHSSKLILV